MPYGLFITHKHAHPFFENSIYNINLPSSRLLCSIQLKRKLLRSKPYTVRLEMESVADVSDSRSDDGPSFITITMNPATTSDRMYRIYSNTENDSIVPVVIKRFPKLFK